MERVRDCCSKFGGLLVVVWQIEQSLDPSLNPYASPSLLLRNHWLVGDGIGLVHHAKLKKNTMEPHGWRNVSFPNWISRVAPLSQPQKTPDIPNLGSILFHLLFYFFEIRDKKSIFLTCMRYSQGVLFLDSKSLAVRAKKNKSEWWYFTLKYEKVSNV